MNLLYCWFCFFILFIGAEEILGQPLDQDLQKKAFDAFYKSRELAESNIERDSIFFYLVKSRKIFTELSMDSMLIMASLDLNYWYDLEGESERGEALLIESEELVDEGSNGFLKMLLDISRARLYAKGDLYNIDSCLYYAHRAYDNASNLDDCVHEMVSIIIQSEVCLKETPFLNRIPEFYKQAKQIQDCSEETQNLMVLMEVDYGQYFLKQKEYESAILQFKKTLELNSIESDIDFQRYVKVFLSNAYEAAGDYKMANQVKQEVISLMRELAEKDKTRAIQQAQAAFESEKKENQITQLRTTNELKEKTAKRQQLLLWVMSIGLLAIIVLILQALRSTKRRIKSDEKLIAYQNEMSNVKSKMYTNITHEFRTPLTVIIGLTKKLKGNIEEKAMIERNSNNLLSMVNEMLDLSKAEAGALEMKMIQSNIIVYLEYIVESLLSVAQKKNIRLVFHSSIKEVVMDYDAEKMRQVCYNLISNALKFTPTGGKVILLAEVLESVLILKLNDSGKGIPEDKISNVFDRFYQVTSNNVGGTGVGLALVKELVILMRGEISVSSELDVGTEFIVSIPITNEAPFAIQTKEKESGVVHSGQSQMPLAAQYSNNDKIALIVEDNEDVATYIRRCIEGDYKVLMASNGEEGVLRAFELIPDIIISDVMMPVMDGFRLTGLLKSDEKTSHIPIILLTAKATKEEKLEGLEAGADAYMLKPFDEVELLIRMQKLIALRGELHGKYATHKIKKISQSQDNFVSKVIDILEPNLNQEKYSVSELVVDLGLSRMQVHRKLKALTGMSTTEFINHYKLERAHQLIQEDDTSLSNIAYEVGFSSPSYFSSLFKEKYGYEPSKLKE